MNRVIQISVFLFCLALPLVSAARPPPGGPQGFAPHANPDSANRRAIAEVKKQYPDTRVLSIRPVQRKGQSVRRVKTLDEQGVVKYHYVDEAGEIVD